jgi:dTDP-4-amino-4,6-dideoxygalactose transaminase
MKTYPLFKAHIPADDALMNLGQVFKSGFINEGEEVLRLTQEMKQELEAENLILTNSCTSALTLALRLADVQPGDEVISTPMTCVATNTPITTMGAKLVWADINPSTGMMNPDDMQLKINNKTKAVMAVAWAGTPPELKTLRSYCRAHGVKLILDAAHAFGANYMGRPVHHWADYTCYSFQAIKHITTGDGGALISNDDLDYARSKCLKWFGLDRDATKDAQGNWKGQQWDANIVEAGYKFNMNNMQAALGLAQIPHIDRILGTHRTNAAIYDDLFRDYPYIMPQAQDNQAESSYWVYTVLLKDAAVSRDELLKRLNDEGIMAGVVHVPNDDYTCFESSKVNLPGVRTFSARQFSLPVGWWLNEDDVRHIAGRVKELAR